MCSNFLSLESTLAINITTTNFYFYVLGYFYLFFNFILFATFFSHVALLSILKKCLHIVRNKIKKESLQLVKKQKSYAKSKHFLKYPKHSECLI